MSEFIKQLTIRLNAAKKIIAREPELAKLSAKTEAEKERHYSEHSHNTNYVSATDHGYIRREESVKKWTEAQNAWQHLKNEIREAESTVRECEPLVNAAADLKQARVAIASARTASQTAAAQLQRNQQLVTELTNEIAELRSQHKVIVTEHGKAAAEARLAGLPAPATPKSMATLISDLESREATLESAQALLAKAEQASNAANEALLMARNTLSYAMHRDWQVQYFEFANQHAKLLAQFAINSNDSTTKFTCDYELLAAAEAERAKELA
jgi:exonuclease VII small subunit